jgi:exo-beta-1,3-glucanase (GH17 family)
MKDEGRSLRRGGKLTLRCIRPLYAVLLILTLVSCRTTQRVPAAPGGAAPAPAPSGPFWGIAYGPYHADQSPRGERPLTVEQIRSDMPHLAVLAPRIRTYSVDGAHSQIPALAQEHGMTTWMGGWISRDKTRNDREIERLIASATQPGVEAVIVGNEVLYRNDQSTADLVAYMRRVRQAVPRHIPVAYADAGDLLVKRAPLLKGEIDIALANVHPYWGKVPVDQAAQSLLRTYQDLLAAYPGKRVVIGETGWPSAGLPRGPALPGEREELAYIRSLQSLSRQHPEMGCFYFDAFDEPYKRGGETLVEPYWGVYDTTGRTKPGLAPIIPDRAPLPGRLAALERAKANSHLILRNGKPFVGLDIGLDTDQRRRDWLKDRGDALEIAYPKGQEWGAVFIVAGKIVPDPEKRETRDYSGYASLVVDLRSLTPGEAVEVGVKAARDSGEGDEPKYPLKDLSTEWKEYHIPLAALRDASHPSSYFKSLYVVAEFVFTGPRANRILVRNIRYSREMPATNTHDVYVGRVLAKGYEMGVNTSEGLMGWVHDRKGSMECRYPEGQGWGAVFITAGKATDDEQKRRTRDLSGFRYLAIELRGGQGGESVAIGIKTATDPDDGSEPKFPVEGLTTTWKKIRIPLSTFATAYESWQERLRNAYVVCELVFEPDCPAETVSFRNIRFER